MPDLTLSFVNPRLLDDVSFHPCVRFKRWEVRSAVVIDDCDLVVNWVDSHSGDSDLKHVKIYISSLVLSGMASGHNCFSVMKSPILQMHTSDPLNGQSICIEYIQVQPNLVSSPRYLVKLASRHSKGLDRFLFLTYILPR